ncbi:hypothetical protein MCOR25_010963, partial [Pyricularia grisea]
ERAVDSFLLRSYFATYFLEFLHRISNPSDHPVVASQVIRHETFVRLDPTNRPFRTRTLRTPATYTHARSTFAITSFEKNHSKPLLSHKPHKLTGSTFHCLRHSQTSYPSRTAISLDDGHPSSRRPTKTAFQGLRNGLCFVYPSA